MPRRRVIQLNNQTVWNWTYRLIEPTPTGTTVTPNEAYIIATLAQKSLEGRQPPEPYGTLARYKPYMVTNHQMANALTSLQEKGIITLEPAHRRR